MRACLVGHRKRCRWVQQLAASKVDQTLGPLEIYPLEAVGIVQRPARARQCEVSLSKLCGLLRKDTALPGFNAVALWETFFCTEGFDVAC